MNRALLSLPLVLTAATADAACVTPGTILVPLMEQRRLATHKMLEPVHLERLFEQIWKEQDPQWLRRFDTGLFVAYTDGTGFLYIGYDHMLCRGDALDHETLKEIRALVMPIKVARVPEIRKPLSRFRQRARATRTAQRPVVQIERPAGRAME